MIVYNLCCKDCTYQFEGWFEDSATYSKQKNSKQINCPNCESYKIFKVPVAPNVAKKSNAKEIKNKRLIASKIDKIKKIVEKNYDYVGDNFTEEAKKIKYGETKDRPIYGEANLEQTKELIEEEIDIVPLPFSNKKKN